jgi:glycosyltransferase involved in cell wall biosynthesis
MKILAYVRKDCSPDYHRITLPLLHMEGVQVFVTNNLLAEHFEGVDLFVYNRVLPQRAMAEVNRLRERHGFSIGVDVDDYWHLDQLHPYHHEYVVTGYAVQQVSQLRNADFVTVTHSRLATLVSGFNQQVHVVPNAIPKEGQFTPFECLPSEGVRLFWQGSITHQADVRLIAPAIEKLIGTPHVEMVLAGHVEGERIWQHIARDYTASARLKHCIIGGMHHEYYYQAYREADVCLVPLLNSTFNRLKSNLKVLEAANLGLPVIAHNVHPYKDLPVLYANGTQRWYEAMKLMVSSSAARFEGGQRLKEYCDYHFNFNRINEARKQVFEYYCQD